ncbi:hypothetical protein LZ30DRAFT_208444 [Colletotrichum cereale]|nr:hypothetical protein LZ30DRAFT_208444 [Colletotrichum cereale]
MSVYSRDILLHQRFPGPSRPQICRLLNIPRVLGAAFAACRRGGLRSARLPKLHCQLELQCCGGQVSQRDEPISSSPSRVPSWRLLSLGPWGGGTRDDGAQTGGVTAFALRKRRC